MYFFTPLFLAALALAAPQDAIRRSPSQCPSGSYQCSNDLLGWEVCNAHGEWVNAGSCQNQSTCYIHPHNNLPYCTESPKIAVPSTSVA
ncbi:hypothetical protein F5X96DRAFT_671516 [Biscogniauxia mediterranea]|nr:hypothetical protein F5X96DRAFT_671516 [Biscogniauxia mediterranea]